MKSVIDFFKDDGPILAAAISCYFMLALVPFLLLLVELFGFLLGHYPEFHDFFRSLVARLFPQATLQVTQELQVLIDSRGIGMVTLVLYALFSYQLFVSLETAVQFIFKVRAKRSLAASVLLSLLLVTLLVLFTILSFGATWILSWLRPISDFFPGPKIGSVLTLLSGFGVPLLLLFLTATSLYLLLPPTKVPLGHAALGGFGAAVFFELANHGVSWFMAIKISRLGIVYGSLAVVVTLLVWLVYSFSIFLVGAELVSNLSHRGKEERHKPPRFSDMRTRDS